MPYFSPMSHLSRDAATTGIFIMRREAAVSFSICTAGSGWYQEEGKEAVSLEPGTVITIPPEVKHWHGAKADSWFSHIAVEVPGDETSNEWLEAVDDEVYSALK